LSLLNITTTKTFNTNELGNDYFVGDIHGQYSLLIEQLKSADFNFKTDRLFAVGDIIDRGSESEKCLELLIEPWFNSVLGNHEQLFLQGFSNASFWKVLVDNGGYWINNWLNNPSKLLAWAHLIRIKMPLSFTIKNNSGTIGVIHADAPTNWSELENLEINEQSFSPFIWYRRNLLKPSGNIIKNIDAVIHGHNSMYKPVVINNQLWIDTLQKTNSLTILRNSEIFDLIKGKN
jgi:serine/threonine protein phosphatase 1